jgi:hypothetical protein
MVQQNTVNRKTGNFDLQRKNLIGNIFFSYRKFKFLKLELWNEHNKGKIKVSSGKMNSLQVMENLSYKSLTAFYMDKIHTELLNIRACGTRKYQWALKR